jgi:hypothetical protein
MIGLRIGVAELAEIEAGAPCVVLAPGRTLPHWPPLVPLELRDGVLARPGAAPARALPLPRWAAPLALIASDAEAELLRPILPHGLPVVPDADGVVPLLAAALRDAQAARDAAAAERDRLKRAVPAPLARMVLDLAPAGAATLPATQPLGRAAEGLCGIALHVAEAGSAPLTVTLRTATRLLGRWNVPAAALAPGWLALDLPEPAPPGSAEAVIEVAGDARLSATAEDPGAPLAQRVMAAGPGWSVLPLHFDWAASFGVSALPLPLPRAVLEAAEVVGASATLLGLGGEPARLLLDLRPGGEATIILPPLDPGPADLLRLRLVLREGAPGEVGATLTVGDAAVGPRRLDPGADFALPLPPGAAPRIGIALRHAGTTPAVVEIASIALAAGAAGEPRRAPPPQPLALAPSPAADGAPRVAVALAGVRLPEARPEAPAAARAAGSLSPPPVLTTPAAYQELRLHQHLVNGEGTYRHLEVGLTSLVAGGGLWRQVRLKLFERRGTVGLEFREMKGWPAMFDAWPGGGTDQYGPFWRLETEGTATALRALSTPHDRALVAALADLLPAIAGRGAEAASLTRSDIEAWMARAARLAAAVDAVRRG